MARKKTPWQEFKEEAISLYRDIKGQKAINVLYDIFRNSGIVNRDGQMPEIVKGGTKKTEYGWHLIMSLPPGISFKKILEKKQIIGDGLKAFIEVEMRNYYLHMHIMNITLPTKVPFYWDPTPYIDKMSLPIPIGLGYKGPIIVDLATFPHLLEAGATGYGKSATETVILMALLMLPAERVRVGMIDKKGVDFYFLKDLIAYVDDDTEEEIILFLQTIWREHLRRKKLFQRKGVKKIQDYNKKFPNEPLDFIVILIDEFAELQHEDCHMYIDKIVRLSRAMGIHIIAATQRPSTKNVMSGDMRGQFPGRISFLVSSETDSRMILGEEHSEAAWLEAIPGRGIFKHGVKTEQFQGYFLEDDKALELAKMLPSRRDKFEYKTEMLLP